MEVTYSQATRMVTTYVKSGLVPMIEGSPGIGKSSIVRQLADTFNLKVIDLRLSQCDPTDLLGFPQIHETNGQKKAGYVPMDTFPIEGDPLPINKDTGHQYSGWVLFLDEFTSANRAVQAAGYKLILDRMIGQHFLHKNVAIICAGNKETDGAIVEPMSTALQSRLVHLELVLSHKEWLDHAFENGFDQKISDYMKFKPGQLYTFSPDHTDKTYACPRTWEFASKLLRNITDLNDKDTVPLLAGTVSEGVAREFVNFCKVYKDLPKIPDIIARPESITVPGEPSVLWALTGSLANHAQTDTISPIMKFVNRMAKEFQVITLRELIRRNPSLRKTPPIVSWITVNGELLF